jgi:hypothetical protein
MAIPATRTDFEFVEGKCIGSFQAITNRWILLVNHAKAYDLIERSGCVEHALDSGCESD